MKDYDETEAIAAMLAVLRPDRRDEDAVYEILDLIYDYYEDNGDLDITLDDDEAETDIEAMVAAIAKQLRRHPASTNFDNDEIKAMIEAETAYQESLL
jgi:hypothetical protein